METYSDPLFGRVHALAVGLLEDTLTAPERRELESLLLNNSAARRIYLEHVQESACLRWLCVDECPNTVEVATRVPDQSRRRRTARAAAVIFGGGLACVLVAVAVNGWFSAAVINHSAGASESVAVAGPAIPNNVETPQLRIVEPSRDDRREVATITGLGAARWQLSAGRGQLLCAARLAIACDFAKGRRS